MRINDLRAGFVFILVMLVLTSFFSINLFLKQRSEKDSLDINGLPLAIADWKGKDVKPEEGTYDILETHNLVFREYTNAGGKKAYLLVTYSETNRSVFHPPEVCITGSGVNIIKNIAGTIDLRGRAAAINEIFASSGSGEQVILYCYKVGDIYVRNYFLQQLYFVFNQFFAKSKGGAMIRASMDQGPDRNADLLIIRSFMAEVLGSIEILSH
jgi:EpsI family protein